MDTAGPGRVPGSGPQRGERGRAPGQDTGGGAGSPGQGHGVGPGRSSPPKPGRGASRDRAWALSPCQETLAVAWAWSQSTTVSPPGITGFPPGFPSRPRTTLCPTVKGRASTSREELPPRERREARDGPFNLRTGPKTGPNQSPDPWRGFGSSSSSYKQAQRGTRVCQNHPETTHLLKVSKVKSKKKGNRAFPNIQPKPWQVPLALG